MYSQAAREGAPQARQIADRFHLLQNLRESIEEQMTRMSWFAGRSLLSSADSRGGSGLEDDLQPNRRTQRDARHALFDRAQALHATGKAMRDIAAAIGIGWRTVTRWVRSGRLEDRAAITPAPRSPRYFKDYLSSRWDAGCTHGRQLLQEIRRRGTQAATPTYRGSSPLGAGEAVNFLRARSRPSRSAGRLIRRRDGRSRRSWPRACA